MKKLIEESKFLLYQNDDGNINVDAILKAETIWLTQKSMAELFNCSTDNVGLHLKKIYINEELEKESTTEVFSVVQIEGSRKIERKLEFYNLDAIIAIGYRVNSKQASHFRIWATKVLKDYIVKGFVIDKEKLKNGPKFGKDYYDELLETIKEIRVSERRVYQKITDVFESTSIDYNKDANDAFNFFKIVQNKLHYAIAGKTAAELIYERVDNKKINMGLTSWKKSPNGKILKYDINIAKNYLNKKEMEKLDDLTNLFLDIAETEAKEQKVMTMKDWLNITDELLKYRKKGILLDSGRVSHKQATDKTKKEYEKYRIKQDEKYISSMDELYKKYLEESKK